MLLIKKRGYFQLCYCKQKNINLQNNLDNHLEIKITYEDNLRVQKKEEFTLCFYEVPANAIGQINTVERKFLREFEKIKDEIGNVSKKIENLEEKLDHYTIDEKNK